MSWTVSEAVIAVVTGILILAVPTLLNYFVAIYLIVIGVVKLANRASR
jgi:hypothetical protein